MNLAQAFQLSAALAKLGPLLVGVATKIITALPGGITADEAEAIAVEAFEGEDLKLSVKGRDIIDDETQKDLISATARIARNLVDALAAPKGGE